MILCVYDMSPQRRSVSQPQHDVHLTLYCRLRRSLSAGKRCFLCGKMIYFNVLACKICRINLHDSCSQKHSCSQFNSGKDMVLRYSCVHESKDGYYDPPAVFMDQTKLSKSSKTDIYAKVKKWLSANTKKNVVRSRSDEKHTKGRFGLKSCDIVQSEKRSTKKRLKLFLRRSSPLNHSLRSAPPEGTVVSPEDMGPPSSGYMSAASSIAHTPSPEQDHYQRCNRDDAIRNSFTSPQQRLSPTVLLPDPLRSRVTIDYCIKPFGAKSRTLSLESKARSNEALVATWPPSGRHFFNFDEEVDDDIEHDYLPSIEECETTSQALVINNGFLDEWTIPIEDLTLTQRLRNGRSFDIHSGSWHGDVMVHNFYTDTNKNDIRTFIEDVEKLSMIRHENILLFMGVCITPNKHAIITSMRKGVSLHDHIHRNSNKLSLHTKVNIARQVAQGMGYLHAKGIVHKKLNSKNIFLESKVKICMLDHGMAEKELDRNDCGCIPHGHLTYISCEMMKSLTISPPHIKPNIQYTKETDIFAFGTVLYELVAECWPFRGVSSHSIIWRVGSGLTQDVTHLKCTQGLKALIVKCWNFKPQSRPPFIQTVKLLQENVALHKRHSSSEPESLNRIGLALDEIIRA